jgi:DNA-binding GntR family transcriptional regulator
MLARRKGHDLAPNLPQIDAPSRRSQITQTLRAAVLAGELEVGPIYSAPGLATQFGVSATPVREAMLDLAKEGMIEIVRNKGFRVIQPTEREFQQVLEVRLLLEVPAIRNLAKIGLTPDQLIAARHLAEASLESAARLDIIGHVASDIRFHLYLLSLWGNDELVSIVRVMRSRTRLFGIKTEEKRAFMIESAHEHIKLVELIAARNAVAAEEFIDRHIRNAAAIWARDVLSA